MRLSDILILLLLFCLPVFSLQGQTKTSIGITGGGVLLSGSSGFLFDGENVQPHREYGYFVGASLFIPLDRDLHLISGITYQWEVAHFHIDRQVTATGYFPYEFLQIPIILNHMGQPMGRKKVVIKEFAGVNFNIGNRVEEINKGSFDDIGVEYQAQMEQVFPVNPEFLMGIGLVTKPGKTGNFHYTISLNIDLLEGRSYHLQARDTQDGSVGNATSTMRGVKGVFTVTYFPSIKIKRRACYRN